MWGKKDAKPSGNHCVFLFGSTARLMSNSQIKTPYQLSTLTENVSFSVFSGPWRNIPNFLLFTLLASSILCNSPCEQISNITHLKRDEPAHICFDEVSGYLLSIPFIHRLAIVREIWKYCEWEAAEFLEPMLSTKGATEICDCKGMNDLGSHSSLWSQFLSPQTQRTWSSNEYFATHECCLNGCQKYSNYPARTSCFIKRTCWLHICSTGPQIVISHLTTLFLRLGGILYISVKVLWFLSASFKFNFLQSAITIWINLISTSFSELKRMRISVKSDYFYWMKLNGKTIIL